MRAFCATLIVLGMLGLLVPTVLGQSSSGGTVYVATIDGTIDLGMTPYVKRVLSTAAEQGADAVLLDINTPGGRLDAALSIKDALLDAEVPVIAYVNREAFSAGALIAISADKIYMDEGGVIGAATPVDQEGETATEKVVSAVRSDFRAVAEVRGRDPQHRGGDGGRQRGHRRAGGGGQAPDDDHQRGAPIRGLRRRRGFQHHRGPGVRGDRGGRSSCRSSTVLRSGSCAF